MKNQLNNKSGVHHLLWLVLGRGLRSVLMLAAMTLTARYLGPNDFGLMSFAISMALLLAVFPGPGLEGVLTQELTRNPDTRRRQLGSAMALYLVCSAVSFILLLVIGYFVSDTKSVWMLIAVCGLSYLPRSGSIFNAFFDSQLAGHYIMISDFVQASVGLVIRVGLIVLHAGVLAFVWAWVIDWCVLVLTQRWLFNRNFSEYRGWQVSWQTVKKMLWRMSPLALSGVMIVVYQQIDKVMLKVMIDAETVGNYSLALRFVAAGSILPVLGVRALAPKLFKAHENSDQTEYNARAQQLHDVTTVMSGIIMLALMASAPLLPYISGSSYSDAVIIMLVSAPLVIGTTMGAASGQQMLAENLQKFAPVRNGVGCILNIVLNLVLIPRYKGVGAAMASGASSLTASFLVMAVIPQCRPIFKRQLRALLSGFLRVIVYTVRRFKCKEQ